MDAEVESLVNTHSDVVIACSEFLRPHVPVKLVAGLRGQAVPLTELWKRSLWLRVEPVSLAKLCKWTLSLQLLRNGLIELLVL